MSVSAKHTVRTTSKREILGVGLDVGTVVGAKVGMGEGDVVGAAVGVKVGVVDGDAVGKSDGTAVGEIVGDALGVEVGVPVSHVPQSCIQMLETLPILQLAYVKFSQASASVWLRHWTVGLRLGASVVGV